MTWMQIVCQLLASFALGFLLMSVCIVHIPDSLADMGDPPDLWD